MQYTKLGTTDIEVSRICLGCMGFGDSGNGQHAWTLGYEESAMIITRALGEGITFFDTAMGYQNGTSEEYVGRALAKYARRDDVVVATKFVLGGPHAPAGERPGDRGPESVDSKIERLLDASLARLGMDYVDLYIYTCGIGIPPSRSCCPRSIARFGRARYAHWASRIAMRGNSPRRT
mgnify:CR=1 FL=1